MGAEFSEPKDESVEEMLDELAKETHFSFKELEDKYERFNSDFPGGRISQSGFVSMYQQIYPEGDATEFANLIFKAYDRDSSGDIDFKEFIFTLSISQRGSLDERINWAFRMYDTNGDGEISRLEACDIFTAIYLLKGIENARQISEDRAHELFIAIDKNHDGTLSHKEFMEAARKCNSLIDI